MTADFDLLDRSISRSRPRWRGYTRAMVVASAAFVFVGVGCSEDEGPAPGNPAVYNRIERLTDCDALQEEFDTAAANNDFADPGSDEFDETLGYMKAADTRLEELGCYG